MMISIYKRNIDRKKLIFLCDIAIPDALKDKPPYTLALQDPMTNKTEVFSYNETIFGPWYIKDISNTEYDETFI